MAKVFTMPDVEVGSIIEYRYKLRYDDNWFKAPDWYIQSDLLTRKGTLPLEADRPQTATDH